MEFRFPASTFGHIYQRALQSQLKKVGSTLNLLRRTRKEELTTVAAAISLRPEVLAQIENGERDLRVKTLFRLCDYYHVDLETVIGQGELIKLNIS